MKIINLHDEWGIILQKRQDIQNIILNSILL